MRGSWRIGRVFGIGLFIHWTFLFLPALVIFSAAGDGASAAKIVESLLFVLTIFGCIVLHELGHALTARRFGIGTHDITLLPIGGVARLNRMPRKPSEELLVAIAGPAVNVVIAGALFLGLLTIFPLQAFVTLGVVENSFLVRLMWTNIFLVAFNLLPSFPMDGGRVLRALLAMRMRYDRATKIAATIGQGMAIIFAVIGILSGVWTLALVAAFVFLAARGEVQMARLQTRMDGIRVGDVVRLEGKTIPAHARLAEVSDLLLYGGHADFAVVDGTTLVGVVPRAEAAAALIQGRGYLLVSELAHPVPEVDVRNPLDDTLMRMRSSGKSIIAATDSGKFVGLIRLPELLAWLQGAVNQAAPRHARDNTIDATAWQEMSRA